MKPIYSIFIALFILAGSMEPVLAQATLTLPTDVAGTPGNQVTVQVNAKDISNLVGFQFTIDFDATKLSYSNISNWANGISGVTVSTPMEGKITFVYAEPESKINIANGKFFEINFTVKNDASGNADLAWSDNPTAKSLVNYDLEEIDCNFVNGNVQIQSSTCIAPVSPTSISASTQTITSGQSVTLQVTGGSLNSASDWNWFTGNCGGTHIGTGTTISVSPTSTTTYYVQASACETTTTCKAITITVNEACTNANIPLVIGQTYPHYKMEVTSVTLSPTNAKPGENITVNVNWKANSCESCAVKANVFGDWNKSTQLKSFHNGNNATKNASFTFSAPNNAGLHKFKLIWAFDSGAFSNYTGSNLPSTSQCTSWGNSTCYIVEKSFDVIADCIAPSAPAIGTVTHPSCGSETGSVVLNGLPQTGNWVIIKFPDETIYSGSGASKTINEITPGTYQFTVANSEDCISEKSAHVTINSTPVPTAPVIGEKTSSSLTLSGLPSAGDWIITVSPGENSYAGSGESFTITNLNSGTYTFTVTNSSGCESESSSPITINSEAATLTIGPANPAYDNNITVPIYAKRIIDLVGFQFTIDFDETKLTYENTSNWASNITGATISNPQEGKITFVYADPDIKINIAEGKFFDINFSQKAGENGIGQLAWNDFPTAKLLVNYDLEEMSCVYESMVTNSLDITQPNIEIYPNPFDKYIEIGKNEVINRLIITNINGQKIVDMVNPDKKIFTEDFPDGIYTILLFNKNGLIKSSILLKRAN